MMLVFTFTIPKQYTLVQDYDDILAQQLRIFPELTLQCMAKILYWNKQMRTQTFSLCSENTVYEASSCRIPYLKNMNY